MKIKKMIKRFFRYFGYVYLSVAIWQISVLAISFAIDHELVAYWSVLQTVAMMAAFLIPATISGALLTRRDVKNGRK